ncbi:hypothetical protein BD324DRAFT_384823 [Kockovaella imperatae]|uniref:Uncharacterized protein n=1 Tax=Kockovaella imperatae TaxID=4999 RepID=A0A1Y1UHM0_9TREE|nr:hypothetical protein BD324DRAFT_384823 [Kockovaella imperatae]ORX37560.1 hypothetical protein BD324DRAFT_384823 [Kockovaella imperatae]
MPQRPRTDTGYSGNKGGLQEDQFPSGYDMEGDHRGNEGHARNRFETPRPRVHIAPRNLNIPPTIIEDRFSPLPLAQIPSDAVYAQQTYDPQPYEDPGNEYDKSVLPYSSSNPLSLRKPALDPDQYAFRSETPARRMIPRNRPSSVIPTSDARASVAPYPTALSKPGLAARMGIHTPVPRPGTAPGPRIFRKPTRHTKPAVYLTMIVLSFCLSSSSSSFNSSGK